MSGSLCWSLGVIRRAGESVWSASENVRFCRSRSFSLSMTARCSISPKLNIVRSPRFWRSTKWHCPRTSASDVQSAKAHSIRLPSSRALSEEMPSMSAGMLAFGTRPVPMALPEMASTAECAAQSLAARSAARRCMTSRSRDSPSGECTCGPRQPEMEPR